MLSYLFSSIIFPIFLAISIISYRSSSLSGSNEEFVLHASVSTHRDLINNLFRRGIIRNERILEAMRRVDRADFVDRKFHAYSDRPQSSKFFQYDFLNEFIFSPSCFSWLWSE